MGGEARQDHSHRLMENAMASKSIKIRKLGIKDLDQVLHIQEIITKAKIGPKKISYWREHVLKKNSLNLVALDQGQVVGFIISEIMTNSFGLDQGGWIQIIGVLPKYMGIGIGQSLITQIFTMYKKKKINEVYTAARWDSVDLLSFFKSVGFDRSNFINLYKKLDQQA
jgi:ribosomal protein S18 acetylase RimI-like enzyme